MKVELRLVTFEELLGFSDEIMDFAAVSEILISLRYDSELAGLIGFIPQGAAAYLWMYKTPLALAHRVSFARYAKRVIQCYRTKYSSIRGHSNPESVRWLQFLGAQISAQTSALVEFTIHG